MKRLQRRFKNQTSSEVRNQALTSDNSEYYPIPINLTIENIGNPLKQRKQQYKSELSYSLGTQQFTSFLFGSPVYLTGVSSLFYQGFFFD